jgi:farnesyl-diphosphate farnesyltransferase
LIYFYISCTVYTPFTHNLYPDFFIVDSKKQGAYGKIKTHKESKVKQLLYLDEIFAALTILYVKPLESNLGSDYIQQRFPKDDLDFCNTILVKVSRSFAAVIRQLPSVLLVDILLFYLILRALDTIEDDTHAFASHDEKVQHLMNFAQNALGDPTWRMDGVGQGDEKLLLQEFPKAHRVYAALSDESRTVITDITQRMAHGMAEFVGKDLGQGTRDIEEYNRYCHFVAGLVGEGLSRLFAASGLENPTLAGELRLSDQMGLFLQKTNIIRDYLEDYVDKRAFWPQSVWNKYSETADLGYFVNQNDTLAARKSLECLNELVADALELVPDCLAYLDRLKCLEVFRFCAIPQVMAIATLAKCFANSDVFTGVVKIRKGLSCKLLLRTNNIAEVHDTFHEFAQSIMSKAKSERRNGVMDPNYSRILRACESICGLTNVEAARQRQTRTMRLLVCGSILGVGAFKQPKAVQVCLALAAGLVYVYGPWTVQSKLKPAAFLLDKKNV